MTAIMMLVGTGTLAVFLWALLRIAQHPYLLEVYVREDSSDRSWHPLPTAADVENARRRRARRESRIG